MKCVKGWIWPEKSVGALDRNASKPDSIDPVVVAAQSLHGLLDLAGLFFADALDFMEGLEHLGGTSELGPLGVRGPYKKPVRAGGRAGRIDEMALEAGAFKLRSPRREIFPDQFAKPPVVVVFQFHHEVPAAEMTGKCLVESVGIDGMLNGLSGDKADPFHEIGITRIAEVVEAFHEQVSDGEVFAPEQEMVDFPPEGVEGVKAGNRAAAFNGLAKMPQVFETLDKLGFGVGLAKVVVSPLLKGVSDIQLVVGNGLKEDGDPVEEVVPPHVARDVISESVAEHDIEEDVIGHDFP